MKRIRSILILTGLLAMLCILTGCTGRTVNLNKYIKIDATGYDTLGTATATFDYDGFYDDYEKKIKITKKYQNRLTSFELTGWDSDAQMMLSSCVSFSLNKSSGLSNGDTITLKWVCKDDTAKEGFRCNLKYKDIEFKVKDLEEVALLDPFEGLVVEYSGISPYGQLSIPYNTTREEFQYVTYESDIDSNLSNGDKITITATINESVEQFVEQYGCVLSPTEKEFTVDGLPSYVMTNSDISAECLEAMKSQANDVFMTDFSGWSEYSKLTSLNYIGNYFLRKKNPDSSDNENMIYLVYKIDLTIEEQPFTYYSYVQFSNLLKNTDGSNEVDLNHYNFCDTLTYFDLENSIISWGRYTVYGHATLDELYKQTVQDNWENYICEDNVNQ